MRVIIVMFDSVNRHMLPAYGAKNDNLPNFARLASRSVTFDTCHAGSMPCMPARRELRTGCNNFLHRSWSPLEPFDNNVPGILKRAGESDAPGEQFDRLGLPREGEVGSQHLLVRNQIRQAEAARNPVVRRDCFALNSVLRTKSVGALLTDAAMEALLCARFPLLSNPATRQYVGHKTIIEIAGMQSGIGVGDLSELEAAIANIAGNE